MGWGRPILHTSELVILCEAYHRGQQLPKASHPKTLVAPSNGKKLANVI
jgi:hypothetical protein